MGIEVDEERDAPPAPPRPDRRFAWALAGIALAGLVVRLVVLWVADGRPPGGDGLRYLVLGDDLADGYGFVTSRQTGVPDGSRAPLWPLITSIAPRLGFDPGVPQQFVAALVGAVAVPLTGLAGRRIAGPTVGLVAAGIAAVYPGYWAYERALLSETLLMVVMSGFLLAAYRFADRPGAGGAVVLGALCGVLALTRSEQLVLSVVVVAPLVLGARTVPWRRRVGWLAGAGLAALVVIAPWYAYNVPRFEGQVWLTTGLGNTMLAGACDPVFEGRDIGHYLGDCALRHPGTFMPDQSAGDAAKRETALEYTRENVDRLPAVVAAREGRVWGVFRPGQHVWHDAHWMNHPEAVSWAWFGAYWAMLPAAALGVVTLRRRGRRLLPLLAPALVVTVVAALTFGSTRYRAAVEPSLVILAATGAVAAIERWVLPRRRTAATGADSPVAGSPAAD